MVDQSQFIETLIQYLSAVRERPSMFFDDDSPHVLSFIRGFTLACHAMNPQSQYLEAYAKIQSTHNWPLTPMHSITYMQKSGMSEKEIISEALTMEIETWELVRKQAEDQRQAVENLIQYLGEVRERPQMFFNDDSPHVLSFTRGFSLACYAMDLQWQYLDTYLKAQSTHDWPITAHHPVTQMQRAEMSEKDIIREALTLEIETWELVLKQLTVESE